MSADTTDTDQDGENPLLPVYHPPKQRHETKLAHGLHPEIGSDDSLGNVVAGNTGLRVFKNGHDLIGFMRANTCPVCGATGGLRVQQRPSFTFIRGATYRRYVEDPDAPGQGDKRVEQNPTTEALKRRGYHAVTHRAKNDYLVGLVSPGAYDAYQEWKDAASERRAVRRRAKRLGSKNRHGMWEPETPLEGKYDHGDLLAACYELLGVETYETMDLAGRTNIRKSDLAVLLDRLHALKFEERRDYSQEDWLYHRQFGIVQGKVQWHVPEWVDAEGPEWMDEYRKRLFK